MLSYSDLVAVLTLVIALPLPNLTNSSLLENRTTPMPYFEMAAIKCYLYNVSEISGMNIGSGGGCHPGRPGKHIVPRLVRVLRQVRQQQGQVLNVTGNMTDLVQHKNNTEVILFYCMRLISNGLFTFTLPATFGYQT